MRISETLQRKIEEFTKTAAEHQIKQVMYNDFVGELMGVQHLLKNLENNLKDQGHKASLGGDQLDVPPSVYENHPSNTYWDHDHAHGEAHSHDHGHDHHGHDHDHQGMGHSEGRFGDGETQPPPNYGAKGPNEEIAPGEDLDEGEEINQQKAGNAPTPPDFVTF